QRAHGQAPPLLRSWSSLSAFPGSRADDLGGVQQGLWRQMSVTLRHAWLSVPEESLDDVERHALVYEKARERVAPIVEANVGEPRAAPDAVPRIEQGCERMTGDGRGKDVPALRAGGQRLQQRDGCFAECHRPGSARLRYWDEQRAPLPVHILPL